MKRSLKISDQLPGTAARGGLSVPPLSPFKIGQRRSFLQATDCRQLFDDPFYSNFRIFVFFRHDAQNPAAFLRRRDFCIQNSRCRGRLRLHSALLRGRTARISASKTCLIWPEAAFVFPFIRPYLHDEKSRPGLLLGCRDVGYRYTMQVQPNGSGLVPHWIPVSSS